MTEVLIALVLLLCAAPQVRASLTDGGGQPVISMNLTLVTNSPINCSAGLTYPGVFVLVEYRLVKGQTAGEWELLDTVSLDPTGQNHDCLINTGNTGFYPGNHVVQWHCILIVKPPTATRHHLLKYWLT